MRNYNQTKPLVLTPYGKLTVSYKTISQWLHNEIAYKATEEAFT